MNHLLLSQDNTHTFEIWVDDQPNGDPDDIMFRNVYIIPEPSTLILLTLGTIILKNKRSEGV